MHKDCECVEGHLDLFKSSLVCFAFECPLFFSPPKLNPTGLVIVLPLVSRAPNRVFSVDFLQVNKSLQTLGLGGNEIGDEGARAIAEALKVVLGAQTLIFRLETCFLLHLLSFLKPFHRRRNLCGSRHKLIS